MERREPTFIPEWLKNSGSVNGSTKTHQAVPSFANSDDHIASNSRNGSSVSLNDNDIGRLYASDRTTFSDFRRSSSSNGHSHSRFNGSFGRSNRDREWEKETFKFPDKETSKFGDYRYREYSDPLEHNLTSRFDKDLRHSQSMLNGKRGEIWPKTMSADVNKANKNNPKGAFQRDFPSLGTEGGRQGAPEIKRVSSPGLTTAIQSLPSASAMIGADGWTSALAEVPILVGNNGISGSVQEALSKEAGPSMAEALAQGRPRSHSTSPQLPAETRKLEELAVKLSRQLVPMTSSVPKTLVHNPSEKLKPKVGQQISSSHLSNLFPRGGNLKSDVSRTSSMGKPVVVKSERERNGVYPTASNPSTASRVSSTSASAERKPTASILEKRPTPQAKSRNEFFNLMRKKSMETTDYDVSPSDLDKDSDCSLSESSLGDGSVDKRNDMESKGDSFDRLDKSANDELQEPHDCGKDFSSFKAIFYSEEEEVTFLHSLGWEENDGEEEGDLTEAEINGFFKVLNEHIRLRPSSVTLHRLQLKFSGLLNSYTV